MIEVEIEVEDKAWTQALPKVESIVSASARAALSMAPLPSRWGKGGDGGVVATPRPEIQEAARLQRKRASDVVNTPIPDPFDRSPSAPDSHPIEGEGTVVVVLADDGLVDGLNRNFRGQNGPTNVLSFPAIANPENHFGDVILAYGVCVREAADQGKSLQQHLSHLTVHGVLHLLGYDHETDGEAEAMEALERAVLETLGVPDPYAAERE